jgi:hypothetical protein
MDSYESTKSRSLASIGYEKMQNAGPEALMAPPSPSTAFFATRPLPQ